MACELLPCGHCKTALQDDHCGKPEHRYCAVCQSGDCYDGIDEQLHKQVVEKLRYKEALEKIAAYSAPGFNPTTRDGRKGDEMTLIAVNALFPNKEQKT